MGLTNGVVNINQLVYNACLLQRFPTFLWDAGLKLMIAFENPWGRIKGSYYSDI